MPCVCVFVSVRVRACAKNLLNAYVATDYIVAYILRDAGVAYYTCAARFVISSSSAFLLVHVKMPLAVEHK